MLSLFALVMFVQTSSPTHQWRLTANDLGALKANIVGPVAFGDKPGTLIFDGESKKKHGLVVTADLAAANLPKKDITVEAWVMVNKPMEWGGVVGTLQDNGSYEKGWILGFNHSQFCFGVASEKRKTITYLKSKTHFQTGYWYHVVGTYDGVLQQVFVNGKLVGSSKEQGGAIAYPPKTWLTLGLYKDDDEHHTLGGQIRDAAIWNVALTAEQVLDRFNKLKSDFPDMDARPPVVVDWPTYMRDNLRTGTSSDNLATPLHLAWTHQTRFPPAPAWPEEAKNDYWNNKYNMEERVTYDRAFHLVSVGDRVYFGSSAEDAVFCLDAKTGKTIWSYITEGPVRLAPTIADGKILFGSDDGFAYCLDAGDGKLVWKRLLAPSPRRIPGNSRIISAWPVRTDVLVEGDKAFVCAGVFPSQGVYQYTLNAADGEVLSKKTITVTAQGYQTRMFGKLMIGTGRNPQGAFVGDLKSTGRDIDREANSLSKDYPYAFITVGKLKFGGGDGKVAAFDGETGKKVWEEKVKGKAFGLVAVNGRLMVSTDLGAIHCFSTEISETPGMISDVPLRKHISLAAFGGRWLSRVSGELKGKTKGYALVVDQNSNNATGQMLAEIFDFQIVIRVPDEPTATRVRADIHKHHLNDRMFVHVDSSKELPYTDHLFNLVIANSGLVITNVVKDSELRRVVRPHGGLLVNRGEFHRTPPVTGEGEWSHQYGDVGNTTCSKEDNLDGELMLQWFGKPGPKEMIDRHHRTAAPVSKNGRLFVPGMDRVTAVDAYNGTILWDEPFPDSRRVIVFRDASYLCLDDANLYLASKNTVKLIDPETGKVDREYALPHELGTMEWGHLSRPGSVILGSAVKPGSSRRTQSAVVDRTETYYDYVPLVGSDSLFALDPKTGKTLWTHKAKGLIPNPAIAADADTVYFIESRNAKTLENKLSRAKMFDLVSEAGADAVALDLKTGTVKWRKEVNLNKLDHIVYATVANGTLLLSGSRNSTKDKKTGTVWYDLHAFDAKTGAEKWSVTQDNRTPVGGDHGEQDQHPVIVGNKLYQEPFAYDLESGSRLEWKWPWVGKSRRGCGTITASNGQFFFRNENTSMFDLTEGVAKKVTTETRPGCWVNVLPVGGLLLAPEASSGCSCNFSVQTSLALTPVRKKQP